MHCILHACEFACANCTLVHKVGTLLGRHTQNTPFIFMLQHPQHLGQMAWHYGKGIGDWLETRGRGGGQRLTGVLLYSCLPLQECY